jgi:hypothetical protein
MGLIDGKSWERKALQLPICVTGRPRMMIPLPIPAER